MAPRSSDRVGSGQQRLSFPSPATPNRPSHKRTRPLSPSPPLSPSQPPLLHLPASPPSSPPSPAPPRTIRHVRLGPWQLDTWHHSPYPIDYQHRQLYVCEHCLRYTRCGATMGRHGCDGCGGRVPGRLVYRDDERGVAVYEVDGGGCEEDVLYCQCLCLLSKLFIQHKTVYYDVDPFLFYILILSPPANPSSGNSDDSDSSASSASSGSGERLAAYFSKEKVTTEHNNLACIVTLPHMQQKGYGRFLIQLSYQLTLHSARAQPGRHPTGGPERPLSQLATITYTSYWCDEAARLLAAARVGSFVTLRDMAAGTAIERSDLVAALGVLAVQCVEVGGSGGEMGVRVSRDVKQRMARRVEAEEAKRLQRGDIVFDAACLRLDDERRQRAEQDGTGGPGEADEEGQGAVEGEEAGEGEEEGEEEEDEVEEVVVEKKVRRKGGKRRSVVVTARKSKKQKTAIKRKSTASDDDEWEEWSDDEDESDV